MSSVISWLVGSVGAAATLDPTDDRYYNTYSAGFPSRAGVYVSADSSRKLATVYRCVSILANTLAMFPKGIYENLDDGRRPAPEHPLDPLISIRPNTRQTAFEFWRLLFYHLMLRQNAFAQIVPGSAGRGWVGQLVPLHPDRVQGPDELSSGKLRYWYTPPSGGERIPLIGGVDIWHLQGLSDDGLRGLSMMDVASDSFGTALAAERHAARFFERGIKPTGVIQSDKALKQEVAEAMGDSFRRKWGGEEGAGGVPVLWEGVKFQPVSMNLKDAEFLDSRKFSVAEIARWFGVPPHMVGDVERSTSWGTGIEQQGLQFLIYSLQPWIELLEQSIRYHFIRQEQRYYPKFNTGALLRMDAKTQAEVFAVLIDKGILNPNECRELLERNPRDGGDEYVDPGSEPEPPPVPVLPPAAEPPSAAPPDDQAARLAQSRLGDILAEEKTKLAKLATRHAQASDDWRAAIVGFYGRFGRRIADTGLCAINPARTWCIARRDQVLENNGLYRIAHDTPASNEALLLGGSHVEG
ncbi:MAG TPA: phage portal protein [Phycisphaerae bacterium]|nr:phage portal protein [Phycisphaerae bacterium]